MSTKLASPKIKFFTFVLLLCAIVIGEVGRIHLVSTIFVSCIDLATVIFLIATLRPLAIKQTQFQKEYFLWVALVFFTMIFTLSLRLTGIPVKEVLIASLYPVRWLLYALIPLGMLNFETLDVRRLTRPYHWLFIALAILGYLQLIFFPSLGFLEQYGFDPHYLRLVSTWLDPNFIGPAFILGLLFFYDDSKKVSLKYALILTLLFGALLGTFSRSSYLMFIVSGVTFAILRRSIKIGLLVLVGIVLLGAAYYIPRQNLEKSRNIDRAVSASSRLISYTQGLRLFDESPVLGIGYNLVRYEKRSLGMVNDPRDGGNSGAGIDSSWLLILATMGMVGLFVYIAYTLRLVYFILEPIKGRSKQFFTVYKTIFSHSVQEHALIAFLSGWVLHTWFVNSLFFTPLLAVWGIGLGIVLRKKNAS